jgi:hypothetical protein
MIWMLMIYNSTISKYVLNNLPLKYTILYVIKDPVTSYIK